MVSTTFAIMCTRLFEFTIIRILPVSEIFVPSKGDKKTTTTQMLIHTSLQRLSYREQHISGCGVNSRI